MGVRPETYASIKGTPREEVIKKMARLYGLNYKDAYYYAQVFDTMFDTLMRMGCELTLDGIIKTKVKKKTATVDKNRKYMNKVLRGEMAIYYSKHIGEKEINLEIRK